MNESFPLSLSPHTHSHSGLINWWAQNFPSPWSPKSEAQLWHLLAVWSWASHFLSQSFHRTIWRGQLCGPWSCHLHSRLPMTYPFLKVNLERNTRTAQASQVALVVKDPPANTGDGRDAGSIPRLGRSPWRRKWQPTGVFLPGEFHGQRSLVDYSP